MLIKRYQERVARLVIAQTGNGSHYEDLCQTIFVKMVLALPRLKDASRFEPWLFQIARNVCRDHLRARSGWRRLFVSYEPAHEGVAVPQNPPLRFAVEVVEAGIERLPDAQRAVLELSLEAPRSYDDIAALSNATTTAIKSRLHRARENLKKLLLAGEPE